MRLKATFALVLLTLFVQGEGWLEYNELDCHPDLGATETECRRRGCLWRPSLSAQPNSYDRPGPPLCIAKLEPSAYTAADSRLPLLLNLNGQPGLFPPWTSQLLLHISDVPHTQGVRIQLIPPPFRSSDLSSVSHYLHLPPSFPVPATTPVTLQSSQCINESNSTAAVLRKRPCSSFMTLAPLQ